MRKIDKLAMSVGYEEMAEINLTISQECFHLEEEGANLEYGKMDKAYTEGETK